MNYSLPTCEVRHQPIIDSLPDGCPMRQRQAYRAMGGRLNTALPLIHGNHPEDIAGAMLQAHMAELCYSCVSKWIGHPIVRALRARAHERTEPEVRSQATVSQTEPTKPSRPHKLATKVTWGGDK